MRIHTNTKLGKTYFSELIVNLFAAEFVWIFEELCQLRRKIVAFGKLFCCFLKTFLYVEHALRETGVIETMFYLIKMVTHLNSFFIEFDHIQVILYAGDVECKLEE